MPGGISVVIPNYNGEQLLPQTLPTVFTALENTPLPFEIIVADDCSTDHSLRFIHDNFPQVRTVSNPSNSGFSVTANNGVKQARYDLVLVLNSDVKLEPGYFHRQLSYFEREDTFGVMGRIVGWNDDVIQDGAKYPSFHGVKIKTSGNYLLQNEAEMQDGLYTMYLSGANALVDRKKFLQIGGFNELFSPFYVEDYELSLRAWRLGWKCYFDYQSVCRHKVSTTIRSKNKKKAIRKIYNRNKMYLHAIHLPAEKRYIYFIQIFFEALVKVLTGRFDYLQSVYLFAVNYRQTRTSRKNIFQLVNEKNLLSVDKVVHQILSSVKGRRIRRF